MNTSDPQLASLRRWNVGVGLAHFAQAIGILLLSNEFAIPVRALVQDGPPGTALTIDKTFFDLRFSFAITLFLLLAAVDHLLMAAPRVVGWYEANLHRGINYARWIEYSVSASIMIVLIAMLPGITNLYALIGLFAVNAVMILFGLLMERINRPGEPVDWWPFGLGCLAGIAPWVSITVALIVSQAEGDGCARIRLRDLTSWPRPPWRGRSTPAHSLTERRHGHKIGWPSRQHGEKHLTLSHCSSDATRKIT
jgi:hypothetical protein